MRRLLLALALALLAGCASEERAPATSTRPTPAAATATEEPFPEDPFTTFLTPTKNIGCLVLVSSARCDIADHTWSAPPQPAECDLDWGDSIEVDGSGPAHFFCHGDTVLDPEAPILQYGRAARAGPIVCESRRSGVTCRYDGTGHGFELSRTAHRVF